MQKVLWEI
ncbi:Protein of unknown function [Bacillus wiedmannii]|uniref:Uncharacterized protein n=1 Tax=Bacillus wiedmannii TaxID=1890302 RepID=A0AB37Z333_9BACI|nr:Protein of unknown function [Bacillus wiedmannii]